MRTRQHTLEKNAYNLLKFKNQNLAKECIQAFAQTIVENNSPNPPNPSSTKKTYCHDWPPEPTTYSKKIV